jgi:LPXTG-motif cell wall-anchored protein
MSIQPIGAPTLPTATSGGLMPATTTLPAAAPTGADKSFPLDALLNTGIQVAAQIGAVRQASGAAASRRERIAACGRKPLLGRKKKEAYRKCVADLNASRAGGGGGNRSFDMPPQAPQQSNTMTYVLIGLGVLLVGGVTIFLLRRK